MERAIVRVHRIEEEPSRFAFEISISPRSKDSGMREWLRESDYEILEQLRQVRRLKIGQAATYDVILKPWSHTSHGPDGIDYDGGVDVVRVRRTLRISKARSVR